MKFSRAPRGDDRRYLCCYLHYTMILTANTLIINLNKINRSKIQLARFADTWTDTAGEGTDRDSDFGMRRLRPHDVNLLEMQPMKLSDSEAMAAP